MCVFYIYETVLDWFCLNTSEYIISMRLFWVGFVCTHLTILYLLDHTVLVLCVHI